MLYQSATTATMALLACALMRLPSTANACGGFFCQPQRPILQVGERIIFAVEESATNSSQMDISMTVQIAYEGPSEAFGWVLPVPVDPAVSVSSDILFAQLHEITKPFFQFDIEPTLSATCSNVNFDLLPCAPVFVDDGVGSESQRDDGEPEAVKVLQRGTVGPFKFETIQAVDNEPQKVFDWLTSNGYDLPTTAQPLINYYAGMDMIFVGLQLQKDREAGDIQPITLQYSMPSGGPIACVPIQITAIAATNDMPIEIWTLGPQRAVPVNYFHLTLDDRSAIDWLNCVQNSFPQECYWRSYRDNFEQVLDTVVAQNELFEGHAFTTEFAGPTADLANEVKLTIDSNVLKQQTTPLEYLNKLREYNIPNARVVQKTIDEFIPSEFRQGAPPGCDSLQDLYAVDPGTLADACLAFVNLTVFDADGLTQALNANVIAPSLIAEQTVQSYNYLTRLYTQQDPPQMTKDPFFDFASGEPDVPRQRKVIGIPECTDDRVTSMTIQTASQGNYSIPATFECGTWRGDTTTPAAELIIFGDAENRVLTTTDDLKDVIEILDARVPNQTIPFCALCEADGGGNSDSGDGGGGNSGSGDGGNSGSDSEDSSSPSIKTMIRMVSFVSVMATTMMMMV